MTQENTTPFYEQEHFMVGREHSTATILFHWALADRMGINVTDWKCADVISQEGPLTAGRLAELTGLSTGAITGVIDRLEAARIVERRHDPQDRRKVIVALTHARDDELVAVFGSFLQAYEMLLADYNEGEKKLINDYNRRTAQLLRREAEKLRGRG
jgi:DNA-binding MarR family transcriptional regulator